METQLKPLENQLKLAESEITHLRDMNKLLQVSEERYKNKATDALSILHEKAEMFNGAEDVLAKKDVEMNKMVGQLKQSTNLMNAYELEKNNLGHRLFEAKEKIKELTAVSITQ